MRPTPFERQTDPFIRTGVSVVTSLKILLALDVLLL